MIRKIINIDENKCNGCGACAEACHEGAIGMINGKAKLLRDDYCDGLGDCLPVCPTGAIAFEEREADEYNEKAVMENKKSKQNNITENKGCPGHQIHTFNRNQTNKFDIKSSDITSCLAQWPCQIKLVPVNAPYFDNANLLIAADCTAYAYAGMHSEFMNGKITVIGCPKLDDIDYSEKLTEIIKNNNIKSVTIVRMEVPCCGGLEMTVKCSIQKSGKSIPCDVVTITIDGKILN